MEKLTQITNDQLEKFRLNFSRCTYRERESSKFDGQAVIAVAMTEIELKFSKFRRSPTCRSIRRIQSNRNDSYH